MTDTPEVIEEVKPAADSLLADAQPAVDFSQGKPEGFPDDFWDAEKNIVRVDSLYDAYKMADKRQRDLRAKLGRGEFEGKPPEDINEYVIELKDELKDAIKSDDPLIAKAREIAKEAGFPKEVFSKFMGPMVEAVMAMRQEAEAPPSPEEIQAAKDAELAKLGTNGRVVVQAVNTFLNGLKAEGFFTEAEMVAAQNMAYNAETLKVMNKLRMRIQPSSVPVETPVGSDSSRSEIEAKMTAAFAAKDEATYQKYSKMLLEMA